MKLLLEARVAGHLGENKETRSDKVVLGGDMNSEVAHNALIVDKMKDFKT